HALTGRFGRRNMEYISLGYDILPVLHGRSPIQAYADFMRNFRDTFRSFLGGIITLRYPSCPSQKLGWAWRSRELGEFQCYDKCMLASLIVCALEIEMREWENGGPVGAGNLMHNPENTEFLFEVMTPCGEFFLEWYSRMLLQHGERICTEAETNFRGTEVSTSSKVAGIYWHYNTPSHSSELTAGYYNTSSRDGYLPIAQMFGRYGFTMCCSVVQKAFLIRQLLLAARICNIPLEGENSSTGLDDESFLQVPKTSKLYSAANAGVVLVY
ncbi:hypothetical protein RJ639_034473, partial [Escallonia herrerae]